MNDLAEDPAYSSIRDELIERVLDGWDPDEVSRKMSQAQQDQKVMMDWAKNRRSARYLPLGPSARDGLRGRPLAAVACL